MPRRIHLAPHLTDDELYNHYCRAVDPVERSHWHFLWLLAGGVTATAVAVVTGYSAYWIGQIARRYNTDGPDGVRDRRHALCAGQPDLPAFRTAPSLACGSAMPATRHLPLGRPTCRTAHISHLLRRRFRIFSERNKPGPIRPRRPFQAIGFGLRETATGTIDFRRNARNSSGGRGVEQWRRPDDERVARSMDPSPRRARYCGVACVPAKSARAWIALSGWLRTDLLSCPPRRHATCAVSRRCGPPLGSPPSRGAGNRLNAGAPLLPLHR
jgi:hypothetical protein